MIAMTDPTREAFDSDVDLMRDVYMSPSKREAYERILQAALSARAQQVRGGEAWQEGYRQGVLDERTSEANIGIAGFGAKVEPARNNPYALAAPKQQAVEVTGDESPIYYMRDNHTFKRLSNSVSAAFVEIEAELNAGYTHGMLCSHRSGFKDIHANGNTSRMAFLAECRAALLAALTGKTEVGT